MDFKCEICGAEFYYKRYLARHKSRIHGIHGRKRKSATGDFPCLYCEKRFTTKNYLSGHRVKVHKVKKLTILCQEENCSEKFHQLNELRDHLMRAHEFPNINNCQHLEFKKYEDFSKWLAAKEKDSNSKYVISSRVKANNCTYTTYLCNRSGVYKPSTEDRKRQLKAQGTCKLGFHCTSAIKVKDLHSTVFVSFFKEHYKHQMDLSHMPIPKTEKEDIARKLIQGFAKSKILKDIKESRTNRLERKHLITRKDINNIKREFCLELDNEETVVSSDEESDEPSVKASVEKTNSVHDKNYDQCLKGVKQKITKRATQNFKRHKEGKDLKAVLQEVCENKWNVVTSNDTYTVSKDHVCTNLCIVACRNCLCCVTAYSCTCDDRAKSHFMCKHIHFVKISLNEVHNFIGPIYPDNSIVVHEPTTDVNVSNNNSSSSLHESIKQKVASLGAKINSLTSMEDNASNEIERHLDAIEHLLQINEESYSVKKSCSNKKVKLTEPSSEEIKVKSPIILNIYYSKESSFDKK